MTKQEIARFCGQLKMLLASGLPLMEALRIVKDLSKRREYEQMILKISEGESLAAAFQGFFPRMVISSVAAAERAGNLEETLGRLSAYYEDRAELEQKLKSALVYPAFVIVLCFASALMLFLFVLPGFNDLFMDLGAEVPLFTRMVLAGGDMIARFWFIPLLSGPGAFIFLYRCRRTEKGKYVFDRLILRSRFFRQGQVSDLFRTIGSLLSGGVPMLEALQTAADSSDNTVLRSSVLGIKNGIESGEKLSAILARNSVFSGEAVQMMSVGENSGALAEMMISCANFYDKERELFIRKFTIMLEPALTLFVGLIVGMVVFTTFLPMMNMLSRLQ